MPRDDEGISIAKELNDKNALAIALQFAANLAANERDPAEVDRMASELIELSTRHNLAYWPPLADIYRGWARSASGDTAKGIPGDRVRNKRPSGKRRDAGDAASSDAKG